jgi:predicted transposase YbfD/YdcC
MKSRPSRLPRPRSVVECFEGLPDPRIDRTRAHKLVDILVIGLCSLLTVGEGFTDMELLGRTRYDWFKTFLELPRGIPSHDTFNRVFSAIDPRAFLDCFVEWVRGVCPALKGQTVAIDGKALRRASDAGEPLPCIVSAWASESGLTLGQVKVDGKSNEITAIPELLRVLALKGALVTIDAMGCQKEIAAAIVDKGADYILALKGNQQIAHGEFREYFDDAVPPGTRGFPRKAKPSTTDFFGSLDKAHGRIETRRCWQTTEIGWFQDKARWKKLRSAGVVESVRTVRGESSLERRYYLSSLPLNAETFAKAVRQHWSIENPLHWSLDMTFREDQSRARTRYAAQNLATLRRLALNLVKNNSTRKLSVRQKRMLAAFDPQYLKRLLGI